MEATNYKFIKTAPKIYGYDLYDIMISLMVSMTYFLIFHDYFITVFLSVGIALGKTQYRRLFPKRALYFYLHRKDGLKINQFIKKISEEKI